MDKATFSKLLVCSGMSRRDTISTQELVCVAQNRRLLEPHDKGLASRSAVPSGWEKPLVRFSQRTRLVSSNRPPSRSLRQRSAVVSLWNGTLPWMSKIRAERTLTCNSIPVRRVTLWGERPQYQTEVRRKCRPFLVCKMSYAAGMAQFWSRTTLVGYYRLAMSCFRDG